MPPVMQFFGALGGIEDDELRATFNGGVGMVLVVAPADVDGLRDQLAGRRGPELAHRRRPADRRPRRATLRRGRGRAVTGRIAVGVSGTGTNLQALAAAIARRSLDAEIVLVFADRACPALDWAVEQGIETALIPSAARGDVSGRRAEDETLAATLAAVAPDLIVLAGYLRILGAPMLAAFAGRDRQHACRAPAGLPGAASGQGCAPGRRRGQRRDRPPRRRHARRRADPRPGGRRGRGVGRRGLAPCPHQGRRAPAPARDRWAAARGRRATGYRGRAGDRHRARRSDPAGAAARAARHVGPDGPRGLRRRSRAARLRAGRHGPDGGRPSRRGIAGDRRPVRDRLPGDARRPRQDAPSARPRRDPRRSPPPGAP